MLKIFIFAVVTTAIQATHVTYEDASLNNEDLSSRYRLTGETEPIFYDVRLTLDPNNLTFFSGEVTIRLIPNIDTDEITLHAMNMVVYNINITTDWDPTNRYQSHIQAADDTHFLTIRLNRVIPTLQIHVLSMNFVGEYADNMLGVYVSTYETDAGVTRRLVTSQLQPTFARRAFPCYDEPRFKAIFRTTLYTPPEYTTVLSNMPERTDAGTWPNIPQFEKHEFYDTLPMSTYLIAYLVSDFPNINNTVNASYSIPFRVYSRPNTQDTAAFALDFGQRNMLALEDYIEFPYYFDKMDKVAVPDFAFGAMENWGLVIYREVALLVQDGVTTTSTKQGVGRIICHENLHQWFGNEVTPESWTYTWLNEGFANFFESYATDLVLSDWRMMDQFVLNMQNVFQSDAVLGVNPMTAPVYTPSQIMGTFNAVAYQKSGSVIRMLEHFLTPEVFRRGLIIYIRNNARGVVTPADLYAALQQAVNESDRPLPAGYNVTNIMTTWTTQGGFPVLTVRRSAPAANSVTVTQERYLTDPTLTSPERWRIPINWVLSSDANFTDTSPQVWMLNTSHSMSINIPNLTQADWFIFNKQQTGYYRVNYDPQNWEALTHVLRTSHESIDNVLNRAHLIDDAFNMARNGRLDYRIPMELARYLVHEEDYVPWAAANAAFSYLETMLSGSQAFPLFQQYLLELSRPLFTELGFQRSDEEEHVTAFHRNIILNINCRHGNENCTQAAENLLQNPDILHPDIQTIVYCSGLRGGDEAAFDNLWNMLLETTDSSQQSILLNALGCTSNADRLEFYLNQVISNTSQVREQDRHTILVSVINSGPENLEVALEFVMENFLEIQSSVQALTGTTNILNALSRTLSTREHEEKVNTFYNRYAINFTAGEQASINAIRENIGASLFWAERNLDVISDWLLVNYGNNATKLAFTTTLFLSLILSIRNML